MLLERISYAKSMPDETADGSRHRGSGSGGTVRGPALAAGLPAPGEIVILDSDPEVGDLVAQGVAVDAERPGGAAEITAVGFQRGNDELPFELPSRLFQCHAPPYELVDDEE